MQDQDSDFAFGEPLSGLPSDLAQMWPLCYWALLFFFFFFPKMICSTIPRKAFVSAELALSEEAPCFRQNISGHLQC